MACIIMAKVNVAVNIELNDIFEFYFVDRLERYIIWGLKVKKRIRLMLCLGPEKLCGR